MTDDQVARALEAMERGLRRDDPAFLERVHDLERRETVAFLSVLVLLATGAVLLTVGLATLSWPVWSAGLLTLVASVVVDERHKHYLERFPH